MNKTILIFSIYHNANILFYCIIMSADVTLHWIKQRTGKLPKQHIITPHVLLCYISILSSSIAFKQEISKLHYQSLLLRYFEETFECCKICSQSLDISLLQR
mgnify:CR=1 FL=1